MNIKNFYLFFLLSIICITTKTNASLHQQSSTTVAQSAAMIFPQDMPTKSVHEKIIDQIYGASGLNINAQLLINIKNSYCYLEFLIKKDKVINDPKLHQQTAAFKNYLQSSANNSPLFPTQDLVANKEWDDLSISSQDFINSSVWQNVLKAMICDSLNHDAIFLVDATQTNNQMFPYLQNIEATYAVSDFTSLRLYEESIQLQACMQLRQRNQYLAQCVDWQKTSQSKIMDGVTQFKKTDFYIYSHTPSASTKPSSIIQEQIICYCMFMYIQMSINDLLKSNTAQSVIEHAQSADLSPNFFVYQSSDFIFIDDLLMLQTLIQANKSKSLAVQTPVNNTANNTSTTPVSTQSAHLTPPTDTAKLQTPQAVAHQTSVIVFQKIPTTSNYEKTIDTIYGSSGLNIDSNKLANIKKTYCYLEFLVKLDKVKNDKKYKKYQTTDFKDFMKIDNSGSALMPTQTLIESDGWKSIEYSHQDLAASPAWQIFIKAMICDMYDTYSDFILDTHTINDEIIHAMATVENYYATDDFTQIRLANENMQLNQTMLEDQQKIYLDQCIDWKNLSIKDLADAIKQFKKTDFYDLTHNSVTSKSHDQVQKQYSSIQSPTKEQIVSYYALLTIQTDIYNLLTLENLSSFLTTASSADLVPNFFAYKPSDYIYLFDHLTINDLMDENNDALKDEDDDSDDTHENQVVIQSMNNDLKKMNRASAKSLVKMNRASSKSLKKMNHGTVISLRKMNKATRKNLEKTNRIVKRNWKKNKKLILAVILTVVIVIAVVVLVVCTGGAAGPVGMVLLAPVNGLIAVGTAAATAAAGAVTGAAATAAAVAASIAGGTVIADAGLLALGAYVAATTTTTGFLTAVAVVGGVSVGIAAASDQKFKAQLMKNVMMPMMQGMEKMTQALTDGFIELSVGLTYLGAGIGQGLGYPVNAKQEAAKVKAKMNTYKSSINMAMSIFVTILMTIAFSYIAAQAGAMYGAAVDSGMFGAKAAATAAEVAAQAAAQGVVNAEAGLVLVKESGDAAKIAGAVQRQSAAKALAKQAAKKAATKQALVNANKNLAEKKVVENSAKAALKKGTGSQKALDSAIAQTKDAQITAKQIAQQGTRKIEETETISALKKSMESSQKAIDKQPTMYEKYVKGVPKNEDGTIARTSSQQAADKKATEAAVKAAKKVNSPEMNRNMITDAKAQQLVEEQAVGIAEKQAAAQKSLMDEAQKAANKPLSSIEKMMGSKREKSLEKNIVDKYSEKLANRTVFKAAQEDGLMSTMKKELMTYTFVLGQLANAGFSVFSIIGAVNQDEAAQDQADQEKQSIHTLWKFIEDSKVNTVQTQQLFLDELHKKHQVAVENQAFGLQYYQNFLNSSVNNVNSQIGQALAQQYIAMLTPDSNGLKVADIGSSWGLQTQFSYLYPAQGFISTTLGRPDFPYAQEVAQAPLASQSTTTTTSLTDDQDAAAKLWFNQRAMTTINQAVDLPLDVEISFRILYTLNSAYHCGLYLGGNYHDYNSAAYLQSLQTNGSVNIDDAHYAKMFVIKRDDGHSSPHVGVYENEGKGWITQQPITQQIINTASIYHMKAHLNKDQLTVSFWSQDNPAATWTQTMPVTPCDQRTFGIIFSGIAVEWNVVHPTLKITENRQARKISNGQSEIDREKTSKAQWKQMTNPKFGFMQLQAISKLAIIQGQYLYTTQSTNLIDAQGNPITDYVVFATSTSSNGVTNIASNPAPSDGSTPPNVIVSLVTGNAYDSTKKTVSNSSNIFTLYQQTNKSLSPNMINSINASIQSYSNAQQAVAQQAAANNTPQPSAIASQTISLADLLNAAPPTTGGQQIGLSSLAPSSMVTTTSTISQLQLTAAGNATIQINTTDNSSSTSLQLNNSPANSSTIPTVSDSINSQSATTSTTPAPAPTATPVVPASSSLPSTSFASDQFALVGSSGLSL